MLHLDSDVQYVKGVGPRRAELLRSRGLRTVADLLLRFPRRYEDRSRFVPLDQLVAGQTATIRGQVYATGLLSTRSRGRILDVVLTDGSSFVHAKWFNGSRLYNNRVFVPGVEVVMTGRMESDRYDAGLVTFNPDFEVIPASEGAGGDTPGDGGGSYVPVYEEAGGVTSRQLRRIISAALDALDPNLPDPLSEEVRVRRELPGLKDAFEAIHRPRVGTDIEGLNGFRSPAHRRFKFEEFLLLELTMALRRHNVRSIDGVRFETSDALRDRIREMLPFRPTPAQKRAFGEIVGDLKAAYPMSRLLQGDVGCGKTIVAFEAIVMAIENGYQAALMVPTEILAEQHLINARKILGVLGYPVGLVRKGTGKDQPELLDQIREGAVDLVIGTHALLEESVEFRQLGLVVIDEQHRFGVLQRLRLMEKGRRPNTLVMTATPIPRTLAMTYYGDLDVSSIDEMPPGREPIHTSHLFERDRKRIDAAISGELESGRQCYVVYPLVDESEKLDLQSATEGHARLSEIFGADQVGLLHGRMKSAEKEAVMRAFSQGEMGVLVATTVIEVGVDVPNASLIVIEHAERFGIAQLHQLRGRVGRGLHPSRCLLVTSNNIGQVARQRVRAVAATTDGFRLAEADLRLRGPGELVGTRQSGLPELRFADLIDDIDILTEARDEAERLTAGPADRVLLIDKLSRQAGIAGLAGVG